MKLNIKRTVLVGFAFFLISAFWVSYEEIIPLILTYRFGMSQTLSGFIMSLDNILAVVMLPLFGALSDKTHSRFGKRTPFVFFGTIAAAVLYVILGTVRSEWLFILLLLGVLIAMATFRSPAVALMPDVTVKPLRSKGNAIINLCGTAGGIVVLAFGLMLPKKSAPDDTLPYMISVSAVMMIALIVFILTVRENKWAKEAQALEKEIDDEPTEEESVGVKKKLTRSETISLILILASVALWFIGYNGVTSKFSVYAQEVLNNKVSYKTSLIIAQVTAAIAFYPIALLSTKFGRRKTIMGGISLLTLSLLAACFITAQTPAVFMYTVFALAGIGWATINVNSFPMVVELASNSDVGKFTGYYYTASMAAQIVTPILSGFLIDVIGWSVFFPYAVVFVAASFVTMLFVRHGDSKPEKKKSILENFDVDD